MTLQRKAFLVMFCGVVMFFWFTMLPVMYFVDEKILKLHDVQWFVQFAIALVFISAVIAWMSVAMTADKDKDRRVVQLKLAIYDGQNFILYWNPAGLMYMLARFFWRTLLGMWYVIIFGLPSDHEVPKK
ncbi:MAG: hypothetical protein Q8P17_00175 [bacterium]|nr:hypothetical protein [bacterium]